ncbi:MAG: AraC family transcriptional regulator [Verrucomicrobiae bacterium]|nr:AraC family transcriptional regulator [Verrucomicrobiae bacterium]
MIGNSVDSLLVSSAGFTAYPPGATFGPRVLYDFQFLWIIEGKVLANFDGHEFLVLPDSILLGRPGMTDRYDWDREGRTILAYLHFSFDYSEPEWPPLKEWPVVRRLATQDILRPLFRYAVGLAQSSVEGRDRLLESAVTLMLRSFLSGVTGVAPEPFGKLPVAVEKALGAIRWSLAQDPPVAITLGLLARAAHVTPAHLCRLFRRHLGLGPLECAWLARLERAASLLVRSNLAVKEVANATGFASPYHFSRKFRSVYRVSPTEYRQSVRAGFMIVGNPIVQRLQLHVPETRP